MDEVKKFFVEAFHLLGRHRPVPAIDVRFYPYAGLHHTIRLRSGNVHVRLADISRGCPPEEMRSLAFILVARLLGKRAPSAYERTYRKYSLSPEVIRSSDLARKRRGRKMISTAQGKIYDLDRMFAKINRRYFESALPKPT